jgi:hypothetical protein
MCGAALRVDDFEVLPTLPLHVSERDPSFATATRAFVVVESLEDALGHTASVPSRHRALVYEKRFVQVNARAHTVGRVPTRLPHLG